MAAPVRASLEKIVFYAIFLTRFAKISIKKDKGSNSSFKTANTKLAALLASACPTIHLAL
jgi:hypothetical protein